jgi:S1-C subfamily serine protease
MTARWYYTSDGKTRFGPFSLEQMHERARTGELQRSHMACREGAAKWTPAGTIAELFPQAAPVAAVPQPAAGAEPVAEEEPAQREDPFSFGGREEEAPRPREPRAEKTRRSTRPAAAGWPLWLRVGLPAGGALLVLLVVVLAIAFWPSAEAPPRKPSASSKKQKAAPIAKTEPEKPKTIQELFLLRAPAVPLVEALGSGTGSGFLIRHAGKLLVVTNRHVVENAERGVAVHFPLRDDNRMTIPADQTRVVRIHRAADLAILDVSGWANEIGRLRIEPVPLAPKGLRPTVGDHIFAIGHPGSGGKTVLTSTLSDGIVSAVGREMEGGRFLQVTAAINPGNSGGPLFDGEGRVIGVNTFTLRRAGRGIALESLNFALQVEYVHELLAEPAQSLDDKAIQAVLKPPAAVLTDKMSAALKARLAKLKAEGYEPVEDAEGRSAIVFRLPAGENRVLPFRPEKEGEHAIAVVSEGVDDLDLAVLSQTGVLGQCNEVRPDPEVKVKLTSRAVHVVFVRNSTGKAAVVGVARLRK